MTGSNRLSGFFHALSDPTRQRIVALVGHMELTVGEVAQVLGQSQPRVSRHLRILDDAGLVRRRKEGSWTFVERSRGEASVRLDALVAEVAGDADRARFEADLSRLEAVRAERAEAAARWFESRAERREALSKLQAPEDAVERRLADALDPGPLGTLVDVGTGTGRMVELFASRAARSVGIDRSPEMLRLARVRLDEAGVAAQLRQGDMTALPLDNGVADTVILHFVLHYATAPASALAEAARILAPGGALLLVDYDAHDREELRSRFGHQRLGFGDEQLRGWLAEVGLELEDDARIEGNPLAIKIWKARRRAGREQEAA